MLLFFLFLSIAGSHSQAADTSSTPGTEVGHRGTTLRYDGVNYTPVALAVSTGAGSFRPCSSQDAFLRVTFRLHNQTHKAQEVLSSPFEAISYGREFTDNDTCHPPPSWAGREVGADDWLTPGQTETVTLVREIFRTDHYPQIFAYGDSDLGERNVRWHLSW